MSFVYDFLNVLVGINDIGRLSVDCDGWVSFVGNVDPYVMSVL